MRVFSDAIRNALRARRLVARDFLWIIARDRVTGAPMPDGSWSDVGPITAQVIEPNTNGVVSRSFNGSGTLISISNIPLVSNLTVQTVTIRLSQVNARVNNLIRAYDVQQAPVEIYRGLFDPQTRNLVDPAPCRFAGFVDKVVVTTPKRGANGSVTLTCTSHTQELTRFNPDTRSDASQRLRNAADAFYKDTAVCGDWEMFWGKTSGVVDTNAPPSAFGPSMFGR